MQTNNERSNNYIKQVGFSVIFKVSAILCSFLAMPLMIKYLGNELFGVWATMLTIVSWIMLFDLGIGNGLKNRISESLAVQDENLAYSYISTSYILIGGVSVFFLLIFYLVGSFVPWGAVFNTDLVDSDYLFYAVFLLACFIFLNFWLSLVHQVFHGIQKSSFVNIGSFISNCLALLFVYIIYSNYNSSLIKIIISYGLALVVSNILLSVFVFTKRPSLKPRITGFSKDKVSGLLSLGLRFFVIQIAVLIIFMSDKIIITQLLGPEYVTNYEVVFKLYSVFSILHGLILMPLWPAFSNAYAQGDLKWIKKGIVRQIYFIILIVFASLSLIVLGPYMVNVWIGEGVKIERIIFVCFSIYAVVTTWCNVFSYFVNAIGKINLQLYTSIFSVLVNIPLSIILVKYFGFGVEGVVLATSISLILYAILGPVQVYYILNK